MLQPSADQIDSNNEAYDEQNIHTTHLAYNLTKSKYETDDFEE